MTTLDLLVKAYKGGVLTEQEISQVNSELEISEDYGNKHIAIGHLESEGYALGESLWMADDLDSVLEDRGLEMSEEEKLTYLNKILSNDWITGEIWEAIKINLD